MVAVETVADFAGYDFVYPLFVNGADRLVTLETGVIGTQSHRYRFLIGDIIAPVMPILPHTLGSKHLSDRQTCSDDHDQRDNQSDQVSIVFRF